jgi:hypothetical protein
MNALRATVMQVIHCSTDMNALWATVSRREIILVEKATHILAFVRRTLTGDNFKCTPLKRRGAEKKISLRLRVSAFKLFLRG